MKLSLQIGLFSAAILAIPSNSFSQPRATKQIIDEAQSIDRLVEFFAQLKTQLNAQNAATIRPQLRMALEAIFNQLAEAQDIESHASLVPAMAKQARLLGLDQLALGFSDGLSHRIQNQRVRLEALVEAALINSSRSEDLLNTLEDAGRRADLFTDFDAMMNVLRIIDREAVKYESKGQAQASIDLRLKPVRWIPGHWQTRSDLGILSPKEFSARAARTALRYSDVDEAIRALETSDAKREAWILISDITPRTRDQFRAIHEFVLRWTASHRDAYSVLILAYYSMQFISTRGPFTDEDLRDILALLQDAQTGALAQWLSEANELARPPADGENVMEEILLMASTPNLADQLLTVGRIRLYQEMSELTAAQQLAVKALDKFGLTSPYRSFFEGAARNE